MSVLTYQQAAERLGCTLRHLHRLVARGVLPREDTGRLHANRRHIMGIPEAAIEAHRRGEDVSVPAPPPAARPRHLPAPKALHALAGVADHIPVLPGGVPDLEALRARGCAEMADRYEERRHIIGILSARLDCAAKGERGATYDDTARETGHSVRTLRRWKREVDQWGPLALMDGYGKRAGATILPEDLRRQIRDAWCYGNRYTAAQIYRQVVLPYYAGSDHVPSIDTVRRAIDRIPPVVATLTREGKRAYQETHEPRIMRDLESAGVNGWWVSDHRLADCLVRVADGKGAGWGRHAGLECPCGSGRVRRECCSIRRMWWTVTSDVASAAFVGWHLSWQPNAAVICHQLRSAILHFGPPEHWMRDNGRDFKAKRLCDPRGGELGDAARWPAALPMPVERSALWLTLGVQVHNAIVKSSWSKHIESLFGAFSRLFENALPGWTGINAQRKPEHLDREIEAGFLLMADEYVQVIGGCIDE